MKIITGRGSKVLGKKLASSLKVELVEVLITNFNDGEINIQIPSSLHNQLVIIVQTLSKPANDSLMELLLLVDAARRAGSKKIIAVIPYLCYSRQDRCVLEYGPISASLVARLLEATNISQVLTIELHSKQIEGFFRKTLIDNIEMNSIFKKNLPANNDKDIVIISPDIGGVIRARKFGEMLGADLAIINKVRDKHNNKVSMHEIIGNIKNKRCIIVDDIVDTAGTLCEAARLLIQEGASSVDAFIAHAVLSGQAIELIQQSVIGNINVTDSIEHISPLPSKFKTFSIVEELYKKLSLYN